MRVYRFCEKSPISEKNLHKVSYKERIDLFLQRTNCRFMKKKFFKMLNSVNKTFLPTLSKKDPSKLTKFERGIIAYRYYVLINALD